jgi:hypothetical protein
MLFEVPCLQVVLPTADLHPRLSACKGVVHGDIKLEHTLCRASPANDCMHLASMWPESDAHLACMQVSELGPGQKARTKLCDTAMQAFQIAGLLLLVLPVALQLGVGGCVRLY